MAYIINGLISDHDWHPVVVKHKKTHEVLTIKSTRVNPQIHEVLKEHADNAVELEIPFVGRTKVYTTNEKKVPVEEIETPTETTEEIVPEQVEAAEEESDGFDVEAWFASLPEDLEERLEVVKLETRAHGKYFNSPQEVRKEYERLKKILNK
jgi:hypothetical protein